MIGQQSLELALGLPVVVEGFADKKARYCYPFTLENLTRANLYLSGFDHEDMYKNFKDKTATLAMLAFFKEAFRPTSSEETDELLHAINNDNFAEIVSDIKTISGIKDEQGDVDIPKTTSSLDWKTAVNSIPVYTSTPHSEVKDLTLPQFQMTLQLIGKKINFEYKSNTIGLVKEPDKYIKDSEHPLYAEPEVDSNKVMTMKEVMAMIQQG